MGSISAITFSTRPHLPHSNVRKSSVARRGKTRESAISDWQFRQRGRRMDVKSEYGCDADMMLPWKGGSKTLSVTAVPAEDGDGSSLILPVTMRCSVLASARP